MLNLSTLTTALYTVLDEMRSANQLTHSNEFVAYWSEQYITATADDSGTLDPYGLTNATKVVADTSVNQHRHVRNAVLTAGVEYVFSAFLKQTAVNNNALIYIWSATQSVTAKFDLLTGTWAGGSATVHGSEDVGDGWWRVWIGFTPSETKSFSMMLYQVGASYAATMSGDGVNGYWEYGAQVEEGVTPTPYKATTTAAVAGAAVGLPTYELERSTRINFDPARTPWIGVYPSTVSSSPRAMGNAAWGHEVELMVVIQTASLSDDGTAASDLLEQLIDATETAINSSLTLGLTGVRVIGMAREYRYVVMDEDGLGTAFMPQAVIKVKVEVRSN